jgi:cytochrome bd-type quinol oxidase subunit 2
MWVTALILFIGVLILIPLLFSYKACFYRKMASSAVTTQQQTYGEYDSKGRWYKY